MTISGIVLVVAFMVVAVVFLTKRTNKGWADSGKRFENIYFEGEVISVYDKPGQGAIMCVRVDSAYTDYFFHYDRFGALKIESGIATLPLGLLDKYSAEDTFRLNATRVIVNRDTSGQMLFIHDSDTLYQPLCFHPGKLNQYSMLWCDDAAEEQMADYPAWDAIYSSLIDNAYHVLRVRTVNDTLFYDYSIKRDLTEPPVAYVGRAILKGGDSEIDEDVDGIAYPVDEYISDDTEYLAFRFGTDSHRCVRIVLDEATATKNNISTQIVLLPQERVSHKSPKGTKVNRQG